jgi:hemerythrin
MGIVQWDGSLATGIESVDVQHEELFRVINSMYDKASRGLTRNAVIEGLDSLRSYVRYHFQTEEKLLDKHGYPDLEAHKREHQVFSERIELYAQRPQEQFQDTLQEMESFLLGWLIKHIKRTDMQYVAFLQEKGAK